MSVAVEQTGPPAAVWVTPGRVFRMGEVDYVTLAEIADMIGVEHSSAQMYHRRSTRNRREGNPKPGDLPEPDMRFGITPVWKRSTVAEWAETRPGRGAGGGAASADARRGRKGAEDGG